MGIDMDAGQRRTLRQVHFVILSLRLWRFGLSLSATLPRTAIIEDLVAAMTVWKALGDHLILGMDVNKDVRHGEIHKLLDPVGLREVIEER